MSAPRASRRGRTSVAIDSSDWITITDPGSIGVPESGQTEPAVSDAQSQERKVDFPFPGSPIRIDTLPRGIRPGQSQLTSSGSTSSAETITGRGFGGSALTFPGVPIWVVSLRVGSYGRTGGATSASRRIPRS